MGLSSEFPVSRLINRASMSAKFNVGIPNEKFKFAIKANFVTLVPVGASGFITPPLSHNINV